MLGEIVCFTDETIKHRRKDAGKAGTLVFGLGLDAQGFITFSNDDGVHQLMKLARVVVWIADKRILKNYRFQIEFICGIIIHANIA